MAGCYSPIVKRIQKGGEKALSLRTLWLDKGRSISALSEQKLAPSVAEWVEGVAISLLRNFEIASA